MKHPTPATGEYFLNLKNLSISINPVILEDLKENGLALPLDLLGLGVNLLRPLLSSAETKDEVKRGLLLDVVVREGETVLELLSCEDEMLLIRWDSLLVLDLGLYFVDRVRRLNIERDGLVACGRRTHAMYPRRMTWKRQREDKVQVIGDCRLSIQGTGVELFCFG